MLIGWFQGAECVTEKHRAAGWIGLGRKLGFLCGPETEPRARGRARRMRSWRRVHPGNGRTENRGSQTYYEQRIEIHGADQPALLFMRSLELPGVASRGVS